jgi:hypothetical protein
MALVVANGLSARRTCAHMYITLFHHFMCPVHMSAKLTAGFKWPPETLAKA